ncbi:MAG: DUF4065 domain-containing protein [Eubacterium sp.]|nr:DUF4065 domain-containing protein [Eubacterium sp.]
MKETMVFCEKCRKLVNYNVNEKETTRKLKDTNVKFVEKIAHCSECGCEVYVDEINNMNLDELYNQFRIANDIITLDKIRQIPEKYDIGKRPLSIVLGWGEQTFTRYYDGYIPTQNYSKLLENIYNDPYCFLKILDKNKCQISNVAYNKSRKATESLMYQYCVSIDVVSNYILNQCNDITPLTLQKALYYAQGFYFAFFNGFLLKENCEAWVHGPVYRDVYKRYADYKYEYIEEIEPVDSSIFTPKQKMILDNVIKSFCCYSGKVLEGFTHNEAPWYKTRGDLPNDVASNKVIDKSLICEYFTNVVEKYKMLNPSDISKYATDMFINR